MKTPQCARDAGTARRPPGPQDRRLELVLAGARLPASRQAGARERVRGPRAQRLQRQDEGVRRVVVPAVRPQRAAQAVAAQRRPRRARVAPRYKRTVNRWFDHWLFGVPNGITAEPRVRIQREDGTYHDEADWPAPGTRHGDAAARGHRRGRARARSARGRPGGPSQSFVDRGRVLDTDDVLIDRPGLRAPEPAHLPLPGAHARRAHERYAVGRSADVDRQPQRPPTSPPCSSTTTPTGERRWSRAAGSTRRTAAARHAASRS